ncbi:restriction endonuclease subunit S [Pikeienuella piscinae]|uniref:Restriction endonuclease subunit S n=1 Tax=Pikeienuella piscinae TaxID=2748098 RepID=A0A7L5C1A3_9RHOB|nr:restriction endonuclease subunit S [Pikeienuella piscinae]QIE56577.1 restriction endonuclease subunit S [Pikeienuella piscinae]
MSEEKKNPSNWSCDTIGDHIRFEGGTQPPRSTFVFAEKPGYIRLVQTRDFKTDQFKTYIPETERHKTFQEHDVMIGRYGPPVFQIYRGKSGAYNVALIKASARNKKLDRDFMYYTLKQDRLFQLIDTLSRRSSGQTGVDMDALKGFPLPLPPLPEQRKIAEILRTWDEALEKLTALRAAKKDWLTGITQKLTGRGGVFPNSWDLKPLSVIATRVRRKNDGGDHPVMTISAKSGFLMQSDKFARDMAGSSVDNYTLLHEGEFAYNKGNSLAAKYGCIYQLDRPTAVVPFVYFCFALKSGLDANFYSHLFAAGALNHQLSRLINSGVRNDGLLNLNVEDFFGCKVPVPPIEDQRRIGEALTTAKHELSLLDEEIEALTQQKRGLMQKLLTGEWPVTLDEED